MNIESVVLFQIERTNKISRIYSQREFDRLGLDITIEQWILLKIIHESQFISQKDLANKSLRDPASITRTLDLVQKKGLIDRQAVPDNRRQYNIVLTKKGLDFIHKVLPIVNQHRQKSVDGLSDSELKTLTKLLYKIQKNME
jgi:MarR family transcriptional regulator, transcriptional regulator for hemolysin